MQSEEEILKTEKIVRGDSREKTTLRRREKVKGKRRGEGQLLETQLEGTGGRGA